jgi:hypothetical protein
VLEVEAVKRVENGNVLAVRAARLAIRQRKIDPPSGVVAAVSHGEPVAWERTTDRRTQIKEGMNGAVRRPIR